MPTSNGSPQILSGPPAGGTSVISSVNGQTGAVVVDNGAVTYTRTITATQLKNNIGSFVLSAAANAAGGNTVYTAIGLAAGVNLYAGLVVTVAGFTTSANNGGPWVIAASSNTTLTIANPSGVAEIHAGTTAAGGIQLLPAAASGFFWVVPEPPIIQYIAGATPFTLASAALMFTIAPTHTTGFTGAADWATYIKGFIDQAASSIQAMISGTAIQYDYSGVAPDQLPDPLATTDGDSLVLNTSGVLTLGDGHLVISFKAYQLAVAT